MLMIRFQRTGRKNDPSFRIAVAEKRSKPKSGALELLGSFNPKTKHTILKNDRIVYWLSKGAHASPTVHNLLVAHGVVTDKKIAVKTAKPKTEETKTEEKPAASVVETTEPVAESAVA